MDKTQGIGHPQTITDTVAKFTWFTWFLTLDWFSLSIFSSFAFSIFNLWNKGRPAPITSASGSSCMDSCGDIVLVT
jgi:hypothetical protein